MKRISIAVLGRVPRRAQHHTDVCLAFVVDGGGDKVAACGLRGPRFDALDVGTVYSRGGLDHSVRTENGVRLAVAFRSGHLVGRRTHNGAENLVLPAFLGDKRKIMSGGVVARVHLHKPVGAGEIGVGAAQRGRAGVHQRVKVVQVAVAQVIPHGLGGLVGAWQHHRVQHAQRAHGLTRPNVGRG